MDVSLASVVIAGLTLIATTGLGAVVGAVVKGAAQQRQEALDALERTRVLEILAGSPLAADVAALKPIVEDVRALRRDIAAVLASQPPPGEARMKAVELTKIRELLEHV